MKRVALSLTFALLGLTGVATPVSAGPAEQTRVSLVGLQDTNPCTGELVTFTKGSLHVVNHVTEDANGGFHVIAVFNGTAQGVSEIGTRYVGSGVNREAFNSGPGRSQTFTFSGHFHLLSRGSADNSTFKALFHITINANGEVATEFERLSEGVCKG